MKTKTFIVLMIVLLLMAFSAPVYAQGIPPLPHAFYGTVTINSGQAPVNTTIEARGTGVRTGIEGNPIVTTEIGHYGSSDPLGRKLVVQGDIAEGTVISFYVNGVAANQTAAWHAGWVSELNLVVTSSGGGSTSPTATPTPTPGGTTSLHIIKYYSNGTTVISQTTVTLAQMKAMPIQGNGITDYYMQGPTFVSSNLWDASETINLKDRGALMGTDLKDLCNLVGGMSPGDTVQVKASDGWQLDGALPYTNIYNPKAAQGPVVLCWYTKGTGLDGGTYPNGAYVPDFEEGIRLAFMPTLPNTAGLYVFGNYDMQQCLPSSCWHYFYQGTTAAYPSVNGLSGKNISEVDIYSTTPTPTPSQSGGSTPTATPVPTPTPMSTLTPTPFPTQTPTSTPITTPTPMTTSTMTPVPSLTPEETVVPTPVTTPLTVPTPTPVPVHLSITTLTPLDLSDVIGENGVTQNAVEITFSDIGAEIKIGQGATALTAEGNPLQTISVQPVAQPPAPITDYHIIGLAYDFGPSGATFNPPATITLPYDPALFPENVSQDDLVIAYYDAQAGDWVQLKCTVDAISHNVTAQVSHFTMFAILGKAAQPGKSEFNWTLVGIVIGAVMIIIGVGGYFLVIRRRKAQAR